jgi:ATP-binding cassette subfamily C (CFTR/MRP) protein 1
MWLTQDAAVVPSIFTAALCIIVILLLLELNFGSQAGERAGYTPSLEETRGIGNRSLFLWLLPLFRMGYKKKLSLEDLNSVDEELSAQRLRPRLERKWNACMVI